MNTLLSRLKCPLALLIPLAVVVGWTADRTWSSSVLTAGTALKVNLEGLVDRSEIVIEGRVKRATSRPAPGRIETEYEIEVARTFLGEEQQTRTFVMPGGVLPDGTGMIMPGVPRLREGEDTILFLSRESFAGMRVPVGLSQGRFQVKTSLSGHRVVLRAHEDLGLLDPESGDIREVRGSELHQYPELIAKIHAACEARSRRERGEQR
ncbi:MAG: hypothetical protein MK297_08755 [Planctomycetes bacterium]|nr:hypothetical protein [Planctomycetota bacterium]